MKKLIDFYRNELLGPEWKALSFKHKVYVWYWALSFPLLSVGEETPFWIVILVVLNFINASRLIKKIPLGDKDWDELEK